MQKDLEGSPLMYLLDSLDGRDKIAFKNEALSNQRLKNSFICNLWSWTTKFIDDGPLSLISFIDWLGSW